MVLLRTIIFLTELVLFIPIYGGTYQIGIELNNCNNVYLSMNILVSMQGIIN